MIRGKVAMVLNSREVALNIGSNVGVEIGMIFNIMSQKLEDITDPDTGDVLGSVERPKVRVKVVDVQEKLSVASTYRTKSVNVGGTGQLAFGSVARALSPPKWEKRTETLKTDEAAWQEMDEMVSYVKTGDPVVQVLRDES